MFSLPDRYGGTKDVFQVAQVSERLQENQDFLDIPLSTTLRDLIPHPEELKPTETKNHFCI